MLDGIEGAGEAILGVDAQRREQLEHLSLDGHIVARQRWNNTTGLRSQQQQQQK